MFSPTRSCSTSENRPLKERNSEKGKALVVEKGKAFWEKKFEQGGDFT